MGQSASKGLGKAAQKVSQQAPSQLKRPPIPSRSSSVPEPTAQNPASFLRGEGIASQDVRDQGQEMYLQHVQQQRQQQMQKEKPEQQSNSPSDNMDMPEDLLKFIQDVGPAKQSVDRDFTSSRLLKEENKEELVKMESVRTAKRERVRMPLIQGDGNFTTEKNTNFSDSKTTEDEYDFGLTNLQFYDLLTQSDVDVKDFRQKIVAQSGSETSEAGEFKKQEVALLSQSLDVLEVPTLRINADWDILGLYAKDVPGPEMPSVKPIPETKAMLVLKDLTVNGARSQTQSVSNSLGKSTGESKVPEM